MNYILWFVYIILTNNYLLSFSVICKNEQYDSYNFFSNNIFLFFENILNEYETIMLSAIVFGDISLWIFKLFYLNSVNYHLQKKNLIIC